MDLLINIVAFVFSLGLIVALHELGHFFFAKKANILCHEYAIGMGPLLWSKRKGETLYSIRAIPIGGFVSMAGEQIENALLSKGQTIGVNFEGDLIKEIILNNAKPAEKNLIIESFDLYDDKNQGLFIEGTDEGVMRFYSVKKDAFYILSEKKKIQVAPYNRSFESRSLWQRFLTIFGGPAMNFVLAFFIFLIVASIQGKPVNSNVIGQIVPNNPANFASIVSGDKIISIDGVVVDNWTTIGQALNDSMGEENLSVVIERNGQLITLFVNPRIDINAMGISNYYKEKIGGNDIYGVKLSNGGAVIGSSFGISKDLLKTDDIITAVKLNNKTYTISSWADLVSAINQEEGGDAVITIKRGQETLTVNLPIWEDSVLSSQGVEKTRTTLGISPNTKFDFVYSISSGFTSIGTSVSQVIAVIGLLFGGSDQISVSNLSGPVGIFNIVGQYAQQGFAAFLFFVGFLSVNIGVMNLLPIPALDGGRLVFLGIEAVIRKPLNRKVENTANNIMFILLMALFVYVTFYDILRLF
ncbi:regulator of sigma E protease [Acholeplasma morum]|uniref:M50 family metallopeptidase n=1 Tax=Paracholeplasma morum TaxID=264637 RepID=UPI00195CC779|nr:site-2 protease family protein [Paracholeplasma morum]MBM7453460.1 regulator of sigma E protease [Paracholeplasma morum]